jgi:hypothetical protein
MAFSLNNSHNSKWCNQEKKKFRGFFDNLLGPLVGPVYGL